jgi:hypothetical protein
MVAWIRASVAVSTLLLGDKRRSEKEGIRSEGRCRDAVPARWEGGRGRRG